MSALLTFLILMFVLLAPFGLVAALAVSSQRAGQLRLHFDQFRFAAPLVGPLFDENPDGAGRRQRARNCSTALR